MITSQPRIDRVSEPLNLWHYHPHFTRLPHPSRGRFIHLREEDERKILAYFKDLLGGRIRVFNEWNPFSLLYSFRCLESLYPLRAYDERPWLVLTYEEIIHGQSK